MSDLKPIIPRYYQREANSAVTLGWEERNRLVLKLPTGAGKNYTGASIFDDMQPGRCLFLADQDELVQQPRGAIQRVTGIIPAIEKAKDYAPLAAQIVIGSVQSLAKETGGKGSKQFERLMRYPRDHFDYILSDEAHRNTERHANIWDHFDRSKVCLLTATPFRANLADLSRWSDGVAYKMDILDLRDEGFAPPWETLVLPVEIDVAGLRTKRGLDGKEFDLEEVDSTIAPYYDEIAAMLAAYGKGRYGIAFLPLIRSSQAFCAALQRAGLRAMHVDGTDKNRDAIIEAFKHKQFDWLCNSNLLSTGVDIPHADAFLNLRLTASRSWYQQARGRVLRVLPGVIDHLPEKDQADERKRLIAASAKPNALLFDLLLQNDRLGVCHGTEDFARNEDDARAIYTKAAESDKPQDLRKLAAEVQAEREAALVAALEKAAIRAATNAPITGDQTCALLGLTDLIDYIPIQPWEQEKPTNHQLASLSEKGIDTTSIKSKGQASMLLQSLFDRSRLGYASSRQVRLIRQIDETKAPEDRAFDLLSMSFEQANAYIDGAFAARRRALVA